MTERLQKVLAQWGIASRRQAEQMITDGKVKVNGAIAHLGQKVDPTQDTLEVNGKRLHTETSRKTYYLLLNKPLGIVSTCNDPQGRPTVLDLLPQSLRHGTGIHPVGRLDQNSTGALLLTNDGALTFKLTHPKHQIPKTYQVWVKGSPTSQTIRQWRNGVRLDGRLTHPAGVTHLTPTPRFPVRRSPYLSPMTCLQVVLTEGRNRQIRRVAEQLGHPVIHLHRQKIGTITLMGLEQQASKPQRWRYLKKDEIYFLSKA